ncbi:hypothetical protein Lfu02_48670 [Longispora fulva]|uniref:Uncharacterized protein n=1 Tax=Longispora fulva TaxID=619741 RepID=A0A8J7GCW8_9ACTN|nr:hypothetical protein [Longispora fulva]MBG6138243.1 hypothetical protein [Longispora fulva]GIG60495.1 hypothetical protein Lfu02_48670 [Longispora fulva]
MRRARILAVTETVLIVLGLVGFLVLLPHDIGGDASKRFEALSALIWHGRLIGNEYSLVGPLFATPLLLLGHWVGHEAAWTQEFNTLVFALGVYVSWRLLRGHLPGALLRRFFLVLIAGSMFAAHVTGFNAEVFTAMGVGVGLTAVAVRVGIALGWTAAVLGVVNTPAVALGLGLVVVRRGLETKRLRYGLVVLATAALILGESWLRRGSPFASGYEGNAGYRTIMPYSGLEGFSYPFLLGLLSLLLSFGKGLVFYAPGLLLPVRATMRRFPLSPDADLRRLYSWWLLFLAGLILIYSPWWAWYGGFTWGPRFLLFASLPASLALAVRLWDLAAPLWARLLTLGAWTLSCWVAVCAAAFTSAAFPDQCSRDTMAYEAFCHYTPEFSALWYPLVFHQGPSWRGWVAIGYIAVVFVYLAAPLVRSIAVDVAGPVRAALRGVSRGWRF